MVKTIKNAYCKICKKDVEPGHKKMDTWERVAWVLISFATLGIGFIVYLLYHFRYQKKKYCPTCYVEVRFEEVEVGENGEKTTKSKKKPEFDTSTAKGKVLEKVEKVKDKPKPIKVAEKVFCDFCGSEIPSTASICPSCKTKLKK